jgi:site-specific recombinase XerD
MARKAVRWDSMNKDNICFEKLVLQFEAFNRSEGKTTKTVAWYNTGLYLFLDYLKSHKIDPVLGNIGVEVVREYILYLQQRARYDGHPFTPQQPQLLSPISIQCYIRAIKAFFNWLYREGYTKENRLERLKQPKAPKKLIDPLSEVEVAAILSSIDTQTSWGARNSTIILVFLDTGLRRMELLGLTSVKLAFLEVPIWHFWICLKWPASYGR